ncbi:hypothetical protein J2857_002857 [Neorhizobium galegae]|nr:hypothetical protein [Neorhizobium galegae]
MDMTFYRNSSLTPGKSWAAPDWRELSLSLTSTARSGAHG